MNVMQSVRPYDAKLWVDAHMLSKGCIVCDSRKYTDRELYRWRLPTVAEPGVMMIAGVIPIAFFPKELQTIYKCKEEKREIVTLQERR